MLWHTMAKELKCEEVPAMAILEVFRQLSGAARLRGRNLHRPTNPPTYQYRVKEDISEE